MAFCTNCGSQLPENAAFCSNCGAPVISPEPMPEYNPYQQSGTALFTDIPKRDIAMCILLTVFTCGIYGLYWLYNIVNDLNSVMPEGEQTNGGTVILLSILTCGIYTYFWFYKAGKKLDAINRMKGLPESNYSLIFVIIALVQLSIVDYCLIQNELNKLSTRQ